MEEKETFTKKYFKKHVIVLISILAIETIILFILGKSAAVSWLTLLCILVFLFVIVGDIRKYKEYDLEYRIQKEIRRVPK